MGILLWSRTSAHVKHVIKVMSSRCFATGASSIADEEANEVLFKAHGKSGLITLNRPKALNALNLNMVVRLLPVIKKWDEDSNVGVIVMKGAGEKAFCAGGDVRAIVEDAKKGGNLSQMFFKEEYRLNYAIGTLKTPFVALISGITMGGGVGLSVHGRYRVATEKTLFAMPETAIGLFPDVGGGHFLPRLCGRLGLYLALTGYRLKGRDVLHSAIATHYVASPLIPVLEEELLSLTNPSDTTVRHILDTYHKQCLDPSHEFSLSRHMEQIDRLFSYDSIEGILRALEHDGSEWALQQRETLRKMCPMSMKITIRQLAEGANLDLGEVLKMEYRISQQCMSGEEFFEGVRALLIDKDNAPKWKYPRAEDVSPEMVHAHFSPLPIGRELLFH